MLLLLFELILLFCAHSNSAVCELENTFVASITCMRYESLEPVLKPLYWFEVAFWRFRKDDLFFQVIIRHHVFSQSCELVNMSYKYHLTSIPKRFRKSLSFLLTLVFSKVLLKCQCAQIFKYFANVDILELWKLLWNFVYQLSY